ncbi:MAG TPA: aminotransferase class III-fold pyridoxal phosphate-dependent enzyme [Candidatus Dormibacteraeota bacterium]|nr:aminotransferase class III-fold pyridoxal phosphate-dependent enzyme [Candidatus Dormibacteraeota bacterium]
MARSDRRLYPWAVQGKIAPLTVTHARGSYFWDSDGNRWLDMCGQLAYVNVGHAHPHVVEAIKKQAETMPVIAPDHTSPPASRLSEMLAEVTPGRLSRTFFTNGGAEANEHAIRMARTVTGRQKIVTRYQSYHGATLATMAATGDNRRTWSEPHTPAGFVKTLDPYRYRCPFCSKEPKCNLNCADAVAETVIGEGPETVAAILVEPITGYSGIVVPPDGYLQKLRDLCDEHGILLIFDEVIDGFCRTGKWFASEHWGVEPDIMTVAKGITSGYVPLGAAIVSDKVGDYFEDHYLGSGLTYAAHPLACAAGVATLEVYLEEELADRAERLGRRLMKRLLEMRDKHPSVGEVRGLGLLAAIELVKDKKTREPFTPQRSETRNAAMTEVVKAVWAEHARPAFRWNLVIIAPPLTISEEELDEGLVAIEAGLQMADRHVAVSA